VQKSLRTTGLDKIAVLIFKDSKNACLRYVEIIHKCKRERNFLRKGFYDFLRFFYFSATGGLFGEPHDYAG